MESASDDGGWDLEEEQEDLSVVFLNKTNSKYLSPRRSLSRRKSEPLMGAAPVWAEAPAGNGEVWGREQCWNPTINPPTLLHGTPEQMYKIREYLDAIMDDAGVENKKQKIVYHNRRFWQVLLLSHRQRKVSLIIDQIIKKSS